MKQTTTITIGLDLGDKAHFICVLNANGEIIDKRKITNHVEALRRLSKKYPGAIIAMEVGTHSPWVSRFFGAQGHEVLVANPRKLRAIYANERKSDERDAEMIARIARMDPKLLYPVKHRSEQAQRDLLQVKLRDNLVRQRVDIISSVRFTLKSLGVRLPSPSTPAFAKCARKNLADQADILALVEPSLCVLDEMTDRIREFDREIQKLCEESYPEAARLQEISGVGPITALVFILVIGDVKRFARARDAGPYLGMVPRRDQSGGLDKQMRISKAGDAYLRRLLVSAAQYILGPFGPDCDLRRHGLMLADRGGQAAKKKAVIAIARKLSVIMLTLLQQQSDYQPLRNAA